MNRKITFTITLAGMLIALASLPSCKKDADSKESVITLKTPKSIDTVYLTDAKDIVFTWTKISGVNNYVLKFATSLAGLASTKAIINVGDKDKYVFKPHDADSFFAEHLNVPPAGMVTVFWTVSHKDASTNVKDSEVRRIRLSRLLEKLSLEGVRFASSDAGTQTLNITRNGAWTISVMANGWVNVNPSSGNGPTPVTVTSTANNGPARSSRLTIRGGDADDRMITIMQPAGGVNKLISEKWIYGMLARKYEYGDKHRFTKILDYSLETGELVATTTITYDPVQLIEKNVDGVVRTTNVYLFEQGLLAMCGADTAWYIESLNDAGLPNIVEFKRKKDTFTYDETGNITERIDAWSIGFIHPSGVISGGTTVGRYEYDDKKSPFYACTSPKWLVLLLCNYHDIFNNVASVSYNNERVFRYTHTYDADGYITRNDELQADYKYITK
ncbi:MAG: BACON domain-containing protein [Prevotellaceae bacterium]|jgi:hypothetical protein|nr:BACON domain-containing protein [Prevotellaceae bacterium]